jgi:hypothetical protein
MDTITRRVELQVLWAELRARMVTQCPGGRLPAAGGPRRDPRAPIVRSHRGR